MVRNCEYVSGRDRDGKGHPRRQSQGCTSCHPLSISCGMATEPFPRGAEDPKGGAWQGNGPSAQRCSRDAGLLPELPPGFGNQWVRQAAGSCMYHLRGDWSQQSCWFLMKLGSWKNLHKA